MGWHHQSANGFRVQPSKAILVVEPVTSPKLYFVHIIQAPIGIAAQRTSAANPASLPPDFGRAIGNNVVTIAISATLSSGKFASFVRYVAAIAKPVQMPSQRASGSGRSHRRAQRNKAPT